MRLKATLVAGKTKGTGGTVRTKSRVPATFTSAGRNVFTDTMHVIFHPKEQHMKKFLQTVLVATALLTGLGTARAQDNLDYYWVQHSEDWYDLNNWRIFTAATDLTPPAYVVPGELPDATNRVFINGILPLTTTPLSIPESLVPSTVNITIGTSAATGSGGGAVAVKSISFGGTISPNTTVNFLVNQPLTVSENLTVDYPVTITAGEELRVNGALTLAATGSALVINQPTTVLGAVTVNAAAAITANSTLRAGSVAVNAAATVNVGTSGSLQTGTLNFSAGTASATLLANGPVAVTGSVLVNSPTTITANSTFSANSLTLGNGAGASSLLLGQGATITNALTVGSNATITTNGTLQAGSVGVNAGASLNVGTGGRLQTTGLTFGTGASGASLTAHGAVAVSGAVNVGAPNTTITANHDFSAASLTYSNAAGNSRLIFGDPAVAGTTASITGAVSINAAVAVTANNTSNNTLSMGSLTFGAPVAGASLTLNRPTTVAGAVLVSSPTTITTTNAFSANSLTLGNGAGASTLLLGQGATITNALTVGSNATITTNGTLQAGSVSVDAAASLNVGAAGRLQTATLNFGAGSANATLTANGPVAVTGAVNVYAKTNITANNTFSALSLTYFDSAGTSSLLLGQGATITNALTVGSNATITTNGTLQAGSVGVNAGASLIVNNSGSLQTTGLTFGLGANGASLTAHGAVTVSGAVSVSAPTTITANHNFSAASLTYSNTAGTSTLLFGNPAVAGTTASITGAVSINAPVAITANNTSENTLTMGSLAFGTDAVSGANRASLTLNRPTVVAGTVTYNAGATITANSALTIGGTLTFAPGVTTGSLVINRAVRLGGSLSLAGPNNITGNATTGSLTFTSTATTTTIFSAGTVYNIPVLFDGLATNGTRGRWILQDNMTIGVNAQFVNGYVVALPASVASADPLNPNAVLPPTEPYDATKPTTVVSSPMLIFNTSTNPAAYATSTGASNNSHVIGYVRKLQVEKATFEVAGRESSFTFPIGNGTYYRPLTMFDPSSAIADWTARYLSVDPVASSGINPNRHSYAHPLQKPVSNKEFWYLTASASANTRFTVSYMHPDPAIVQSNYYRVDKWQGLTIAGMSTNDKNATWKDINGSPTYPGANGGTISTSSAMGSSAWFTIARRDQTPLPVRLVSFTGQQLDGQVQLKWQSSSEENTSHFEVEKSADGQNFSLVLTKKAQGNSTSLVSYNAIDSNPLAGTSYYRLKMVDLDGTFEYSKLVSVNSEGTVLVRVYPNPSQGNGVSFTAGNGSKLVLKSVSDLFGKTVGYQQRNAAEGLQVSFAQPLPAGFYVATLLSSDNGALVKVKFVVQ